MINYMRAWAADSFRAVILHVPLGIEILGRMQRFLTKFCRDPIRLTAHFLQDRAIQCYNYISSLTSSNKKPQRSDTLPLKISTSLIQSLNPFSEGEQIISQRVRRHCLRSRLYITTKKSNPGGNIDKISNQKLPHLRGQNPGNRPSLDLSLRLIIANNDHHELIVNKNIT